MKDGRLVLPNGPSYRYLVLCDPQCTTMSAATLSKIRQLVEQGLTLVGKRPKRTPGLAGLPAAEAELKTAADALWGVAPAEQGDRQVGRGRVVWGRTLGELLAADGVLPDCEAASASKPFEITWLHRRSVAGDIYFLANPLKQPLDVVVTLRATGKVVQLFDPLDGSVSDLPEKTALADGRTAVPLHFESEQALFVVLRDGPEKAGRGRNFPGLKPVTTVDRAVAGDIRRAVGEAVAGFVGSGRQGGLVDAEPAGELEPAARGGDQELQRDGELSDDV